MNVRINKKGRIKKGKERIKSFMEIVLSISFGAWFVISALLYGKMVKKGREE